MYLGRAASTRCQIAAILITLTVPMRQTNRRMRWETIAMSRYQLRITGGDLPPVEEALAEVAVEEHGMEHGKFRPLSGQDVIEGSEMTVILDAEDGLAARAIVIALLPEGNDAVVGDAKRIDD
jgi:hypothetical protein